MGRVVFPGIEGKGGLRMMKPIANFLTGRFIRGTSVLVLSAFALVIGLGTP